jgi:type I restriction enzyme M protein
MTVTQQTLEVVDLDALVAVLVAYGMDLREITDIVASLILLRWLDLADAEAAAEAAFEERTHLPLFPPGLQWRSWCGAESLEIADRLDTVAQRVTTTVADTGPGVHLRLLSAPLKRLLQLKPAYLADAVQWVAALPMETPSERRAALQAFDSLLTKAASPYDAESATPMSLAKLMVSLADPRPGESVFDPSFGRAGLLVSAWRHAEASHTGRPHRPGALIDIAGVEIHPQAFLLGLTRLILAGAASARLALGNSLESDLVRGTAKSGFDVILANPPIGAKTQRDNGGYHQFPFVTPDLTGMFVQQTIARLKPQGRAVMAVPEGFLFRSGVECALRRSLIEQGQVEAVIGLPAGVFLPYTGVKGSLLVLRKHGNVDCIRMVDATPFFEPAKGKRPAMLRGPMMDQLVQMVRGVALPGSQRVRASNEDLAGPGTGHLSRSIWEVSIRDLAGAEWDLQARRREKGLLDERLAALKEANGKEGEVVSLSSVAEVIGGVSIKAEDLLEDPAEDDAPPYLRIRDLALGKVQKPTNWVQPLVAQGLPSKLRLLPADLLLSKSGTIGKTALVRNGAVGAIASSGLYVVRVTDQRVDPHYLLGYLASAACQEWLAAQRRGTSIQHLNRESLARLLVPVPSLTLQLQAAKQFQEVGADVVEFLVKSLQTDSQDRLTPLLAKLAQSIPPFANTLESPPSLHKLQSIAAGVQEARNAWAHGIDGFRLDAPWLNRLVEATRPLQGAAHMPRGPSLFSVIKEAERSLESVLATLSGRMPVEVQARALTEGLRAWMHALATDLVADIRVKLVSAVSQLVAGSAAEVTLQIVNESALPLSSFKIESHPDWGSTDTSFVPERSAIPLTLRGDPPKRAGTFSLQLKWTALTLDSEEVQGEIQLSFGIVEDGQENTLAEQDLGGSPYVVGNPLYPEDRDVFFGRENILKQISRQVVLQGNVVLLEGNRRAGKTSILRHLEGTKAVPGWLAVYASLQGAEGEQTKKGVPTEAIFREISHSIADALILLGAETPLPDGSVVPAGGHAKIGEACKNGISVGNPYIDFREYLNTILRVLAKMHLGLLLMLDEFDVLQEGIDHGVTSPQVPENIRYLIQTHRRFSAILTGSRRLKRLREEYWSALFGLGTSFQVTALDSESARRVVVEPVKGKLTYSPEAVDRVLTLSAKQPFLLQSLCNCVFDFAAETKSRVITVDSVNEAASALVKSGGHFSKLWDYAAQGTATGRRRCQYILLVLADAFKRSMDLDFGGLQEVLLQNGVEISDEAIAADLEYLRELELVSLVAVTGPGRYQLAIPLMADWIDQEQDSEVVRRRAIAEAEEEGDISNIR